MSMLPEPTWRDHAARHAARADALTAGHRERRARGESHPVEDFLYTYYPTRPGRLRQWHPGAHVVLERAAAERGGWRHYRALGEHAAVDVDELRHRRADTIAFVAGLLRATAARPAQLGCFGLHEWAMVYRSERPRHAVGLRLGAEGTDAVVESHRLRCTHHDAFRFFTADAAPRNTLTPTRERQTELEQPGCLHAGMDLYKWALKLGPLVPGELLLDCFELARDIRTLDMRASPYDLADHGYSPVAIETAAGKAEYAEAQRGFAARGAGLRARLLDVIEAVGAGTAASSVRSGFSRSSIECRERTLDEPGTP